MSKRASKDLKGITSDDVIMAEDISKKVLQRKNKPPNASLIQLGERMAKYRHHRPPEYVQLQSQHLAKGQPASIEYESADSEEPDDDRVYDDAQNQARSLQESLNEHEALQRHNMAE